MPAYRYVAKDGAGKTVAGSMDAENEKITAQALRGMGLWPMRIEVTSSDGVAPPLPGDASKSIPAAGGVPIAAAAPPLPVPNRGVSVRLKDLAVYFRQLAAAVHSGMPLARCMGVMQQQSGGPLARISGEAVDAVSRGAPLSTVFAAYPRVFSPLVLAMVRAGEVGGMLDSTLLSIADALERQYALDQRIRGQTLYPKLVLGFAVFISVALKFIIAGITARTGGSGAPVIGGIVLPAVGTLLALYVVARLVGRFFGQSRGLDQVKLSLPVVGKTVRMLATARFSRALASLYRGGVSLPEAVDLSAGASANRVICEAVRAAIPSVQRGTPLSVALTPSGVLPTMALNMLRTGEETGNVDEMLDKVAEFAESESQMAIHQMTTFLGPAVMLLVALLIGFEVIRFFSGLYGGLGLNSSGEFD